MNITNKLKDSNGNITSDPAVIANSFNKFFVNVSHTITKNIPISNKSTVDLWVIAGMVPGIFQQGG